MGEYAKQASEFRQQAEELRSTAQSARDEARRADLLKIADEFDRLAFEHEQITALRA